MTLDEKLEQLHGVGSQEHFRLVPGIPRLGVPPLVITNGPAGVGPGDQGSPLATALPAPISLAASFDRHTARTYGEVVGNEVRRTGSNFLEAPETNLSRIPTHGREFEGYGEDPHLVATISDAFIAGVQRPGVIAESKAFAENNQEVNRSVADAHVDERVLRELELRAFESNVRHGVGAVMCAYNAINGVFSCENAHLLGDILRGEWGFDGFLTSDFGAVHSTVPSMHAGLDVEMHRGVHYARAPVMHALSSGAVRIEDIDALLVRRFATELRFGLFEHLPAKRPLPIAEHGRIARRLAEQGMVLLRNRARTLPLRLAGLRSIALIGPFAGAAKTGGGGSSLVNPAYTVSPVDGIERRAGADVAVTYDPGSDLGAAATAARAADVAVVMVGDREAEGSDRPSLALDRNQDALVETVADANPRTVVVVKSGGPVLMPWLARVPAVLEAWYPGEEDGNAVAAVLFGDVDPGGRLPVTFPPGDADVPAHEPQQYPGLPFDEGGSAGFRTEYSEGLFIGYRWYDQQRVRPLFPFGYGLSYTRFRYSHLHVASNAHRRVFARFEVTNTGRRRGVAVPQVYVGAPRRNAVHEPIRQLGGVAKLSLRPGRTAHVRAPIDPLSAAYYSVRRHRWRIQPGCHPVTVGSSERHAVLSGVTIGDRQRCDARVRLSG
jgi:beta-glucosidase